MRQSKESIAATEPAALEFPDWSGMDDRAARVDPEAAFRLCEQYPAWFPELMDKWRAEQGPKCIKEFVL
jgi:hypothetical protein